MNEQSTEVGATDKGGAEKPLANIVRGTMPKPLVYLIRFHETGGKEGDIAKKYGTTSGKIADIVKNRNFAYIDEAYRPTQEEKDAAIAWLKQVPNYDEVGTDDVVVAVDEMGVASEKDAAALAEKRKAVREKNAASTGGGDSAPKAKKGKKAKTEAAPESATEDLMS